MSKLKIMKNDDIYVAHFINDENIWFTIKERLTAFYFKFILPEIIKTVL